MKTCPKCSSEHTKAGTHCSRRCANSRVFTPMAISKKSASALAYSASLTPEQRKLSAAHRAAVSEGMRRLSLRREMALFNGVRPWESLARWQKKIRVVDEQGGKCNGCGIGDWRGRPLVLELEHKDGNNKNDERDNLEALCPNCHSQTPTWRGKRGAHKFITDEQITEALVAVGGTIKPALTHLGLNSGGGNYHRARRLRQAMESNALVGRGRPGSPV
jgi:5-methylcytosine-specific restriction endonuclease McrA